MILLWPVLGLILLGACSNWKGMPTVDPATLDPKGFPSNVESAAQKPLPNVEGDEIEETKGIVDERYVIQPGDTLSIKFFFNPELNEEDIVVRPDGRISLQLVHEVTAANLTAPQLTNLLAEKYKGQLKNPEIAVIVRSIRGPYRVYVDGQVSRPGEFELVGSLSVLQAIARAGGLKEDTASKSEVKVIRRGPDGQPFVINIDLKKVLNGGDLSQDINLHPYDILYVPRSFW